MTNKWKIKVNFDTMEKEVLWKEGEPFYKLKSKELQSSQKISLAARSHFGKPKNFEK